MRGIAYISKLNESGKRIRGLLIEQWPDKKSFEIFTSLNRFDSRLRRPTGMEDIGLLFLATVADLNDMLNKRDLLDHLRLVIILPDNSEDTLAKAHLLRPRYLSYWDSNFSDVLLVLGKMIMMASSKPHLNTPSEVLSTGVGFQTPLPLQHFREDGERR